MRSKAYPIALGGMLAAAAVVLMSIGTIIPVATYAAPVLCLLLCQTVLKLCGKRIAWAWYGAVAFLSLLMAPDKEAAAVFLVLGYYPILKPKLDALKGKWLWKALYFNGSILALYWVLMNIIGMQQLLSDHAYRWKHLKVRQDRIFYSVRSLRLQCPDFLSLQCIP